MSLMTEHGRDRRRFTAAALGAEAVPEPTPASSRVARGVVVDATSYMLCLATPKGEERFLFERVTSFWRGAEVGAAEIRPGDDAVVLCGHDGRLVAERVWAQAARVSGVITGREGDALEVDPGHGRPRVTVVIPYRSSGRLGVRHPRLEPGYVFDAVGVWNGGEVRAVRPATTQPPYPLGATPHRPPTRQSSGTVSGIATWYDPASGRASHLDPRARVHGIAYPALDRAGHDGCDRRTPCAPLPLLSIGATLRLRNDCTRATAVVPVIDCAAADSWLCDLCPSCGGQAAGRIASLTMTAFVGLGGRLEDGCFNATVTVAQGEG